MKMDCEGIWYRVQENNFFYKKCGRTFELRIKLIPLKSRSCQGCPECRGVEKAIAESGISGARQAYRGYWFRATLDGGKVVLSAYPAKYKKA
jgi:hypothetical protein